MNDNELMWCEIEVEVSEERIRREEGKADRKKKIRRIMIRVI